MMQVYYTERIKGCCHWFEFAPQLREFVAIDRMELQYNRLGDDVVRNYAEREVAEKLWQHLYGDIYHNLEMLLCCGIPCNLQAFRKWHDKLHSLRELVRSRRECGQFIKVDDLDIKTLNEEKQKAECEHVCGKWLTTARTHNAAKRRKSWIICESCIAITSNGSVERPAETGAGGNICRE